MVVQEARAKGPVVVVDAGGTLAKGPGAPAAEGQRRRKAALIAEDLAAVGLDAMTLSSTDWTLGTDTLRGLVAAHELPVLAANLTCGDVAPYPASRVVEAGGRRIGLVGVTDGTVDGCVVAPPAPALQAAVAALPPVDVVVGLLPTEIAATAHILEDVAGLDLVIDAAGNRLDPTAVQVANSWVVGSGRRGQRVGLTTLSWVEGATSWAPEGGDAAMVRERDRLVRLIDVIEGRKEHAKNPRRTERTLKQHRASLDSLRARIEAAEGQVTHRLATEHVMLDDGLADAPASAARVKAFLDAEAARAPEARPTNGVRSAPADSAYAGARACGGCHEAAQRQWLSTPHARAWEALVDDSHHTDHACVGCHVTGWQQPGGPATPAEVGGLRDVQCEACHGPSRQHAASLGEVPPGGVPSEAVCRGCHDGERDGGRFDLPTYLPKVMHPPSGSK